ncbi:MULTISPECIES: hypothetical protein [Fischerella]|uniref:Bacteriocin n=1 Tax=Fischerella muscicola CCMEE 5323 TaxID=2019572 RepID=A0A2N6JXL8_FISMU|nr:MULTISPECIES: hypothetical protein [Fischerella]MBD2431000.1 hypothetical protein [Fischerella sp. FACHB-380]PLZ85246.1 hypothetical protein CEN44_22670 [Fischerella muscicola CCMEE 5323]
MQKLKQKLNTQTPQKVESTQLFEELTDSETEKVCGGVTELELNDYKADFKFAKVEFTAEFLTLKI